MLETPHALIGGAVGGLTGNPYAAALTGAASHFAGDVVPHWNPNAPFSRREMVFILADFALAETVVLALLLTWPDRPELAVGAFFGTVPDIILGLIMLTKTRKLRGYEAAHAKYHWEVSPVWGLWPQFLLAALAAWYLLTL